MSGTPIIGLSATLSVNDGTSGADTVFVFPVQISVPHYEVGHVDTTSLASSSGIRTFIPGLFDPGMISFSMQYIHADYLRLNAIKGISKTFKVVIPTDSVATTTFTFTGFLIKHELDVEADKLVMVKGEIKVSGAITIV